MSKRRRHGLFNRKTGRNITRRTKWEPIDSLTVATPSITDVNRRDYERARRDADALAAALRKAQKEQ